MKYHIFNSVFFSVSARMLVLLACTSCNCKQKGAEIITVNCQFDKIDSILITYYCGIMETDVAICCERLAEIQEQHPKNEHNHYVIPEELMDAYLEDSSVLNGMVLEQIPVALIDTFIVNRQVIDTIKGLLEKQIPITEFSEDARVFVCVKYESGTKSYLCIGKQIGKQSTSIKYNGNACQVDKELIFLLRYYSGYYMWLHKSELKQFSELQDSTFYQKALEQIHSCKM